jgi:mannose-1-phosphate guanylyltransferase
MRWGVILAGGSGTRFWPLSTPTHPKQLLPLSGPTSTAAQALGRLQGLIPRERVLVVTGRVLAPAVREALDLPAENVLAEPRAASTGPALVWATYEAHRRDPEAEVLSLHADWVIREDEAFRRSATTALETAARHNRLVTVGIVPSRPETGYGYIVPGAALEGLAWMVARFSEKPDAATALNLMAAGAFWNSGLFAWPAALLLRQISEYTPEIAPHLAALQAGNVEAFFQGVTPISIDVGLLERSPAVAVVRGAFSWDDVGNWDALARVRSRDRNGNVTVGPIFVHGAQDCVAWSDQEPIVMVGVRDLVVVRANGRILIMSRVHAPNLKAVLDALPAEVRDLP